MHTLNLSLFRFHILKQVLPDFVVNFEFVLIPRHRGLDFFGGEAKLFICTDIIACFLLVWPIMFKRIL